MTMTMTMKMGRGRGILHFLIRLSELESESSSVVSSAKKKGKQFKTQQQVVNINKK